MTHNLYDDRVQMDEQPNWMTEAASEFCQEVGSWTGLAGCLQPNRAREKHASKLKGIKELRQEHEKVIMKRRQSALGAVAHITLAERDLSAGVQIGKLAVFKLIIQKAQQLYSEDPEVSEEHHRKNKEIEQKIMDNDSRKTTLQDNFNKLTTEERRLLQEEIDQLKSTAIKE
jgi:hypothetical protein